MMGGKQHTQVRLVMRALFMPSRLNKVGNPLTKELPLIQGLSALSWRHMPAHAWRRPFWSAASFTAQIRVRTTNKVLENDKFNVQGCQWPCNKRRVQCFPSACPAMMLTHTRYVHCLPAALCQR
eukprot:1141816-Pelagomonas_calceolata.AAC.1